MPWHCEESCPYMYAVKYLIPEENKIYDVIIGGLVLRSPVLCFKPTSDWAVFKLFLSETWLNLNLNQSHSHL